LTSLLAFVFQKSPLMSPAPLDFWQKDTIFYQRAMSLALTLQPALEKHSGEQFKT
jgi:hypothetical protein